MRSVAIFGEAPAWDDQGGLFTGKAGRELRAGLRRFCSIDLDDCYVSSVMKRALPKGRDPKPAEIAEATLPFLDELETLRSDVIVTAGGFATRMLLGLVQLSNVHGIPHVADICGRSFTVFPIYGPGAGLVNKGFLAAFAYDLDRLEAFLRGEIEPWEPSSRPLRTSWLTEADRRSCGHLKPGAIVGLDTEGWTERPWGLSFSPDGEHGFVIPSRLADDSRAHQERLGWFDRWIADKTIVMQNGIHDLPVLRAMGIHVGEYHDTQVLAYHDMIRTGSGVLEAESQNLGTLAYRESNLILGELSDCPGVDLASRVIPYTEAVMRYAAMDPIACWRLFDVYRRRGLVEYPPYVIDMGQVPLVETMIATGMPFDADAAMDYYGNVIDKLAATRAELEAMAARYGNRDFNPGSPDQVRELVTRKIGLKIRKRTRGGKASTNEKALADHKAHPFVQKLQDYRELNKLKGTYCEPLLEELLHGVHE